MSDIADMLAAANAARANAHARLFSGFAVGACLRGKSGRLYAGCNVENRRLSAEGNARRRPPSASWSPPARRRSRRSSWSPMGRAGQPPAAAAAQRLREFAGPETPVYLCKPDGLRRTVTLGELLPLSFGPSHLD